MKKRAWGWGVAASLSIGVLVVTGSVKAAVRDDAPLDHPGEAARYRLLSLRDERGQIPPDGLLRAGEHLRAMRRARRQQLDAAGPGVVDTLAGLSPGDWQSLGPSNVGGRVRSILIDPGSPAVMWAGSVSGGIWKTVNGGQSWNPVADFMASLAVTSIVMDPSDTDVLYAATGEGFYNWDAVRGAGVFKSTDRGESWSQLSSTANPSFDWVNRLAIAPAGGVLLAATNVGIFRSTDGGASWAQGMAQRTLDVDFDPTDGSKAVAGQDGGRLAYSTDGGEHWSASPTWIVGADRVEVAYAPSDPSIVYASAQKGSGELWKSFDGGHHYAWVSSGALGGQGWYDNALWVRPGNPSFVVVGGVQLFRSTDGGTSFTPIGQGSVHADHHVVVAHPGFGAGNHTVFFGNDGGVYKAGNIDGSGNAQMGWEALNDGLAITQFYSAAGSPVSGTIIGGTQDNGTLVYTDAGGPGAWTVPFGGDGGFSAADPEDPDYLYGEYVDLRLFRSSNGGATASYIYTGIADAGTCADFIAPFVLDPGDPNRMLAGGCRLWRTLNVKAVHPAWSSIKPATASGSRISAIAVAPPNVIWVGHGDGSLYKTTNGGAAQPAWFLVGAALPDRRITRITVDPSDSDRVYVTFGGFSPDNVWRTTDGGATWTDRSGIGTTGLPDVPVRSLVLHPDVPDWIYAGTEVGIFASPDGGATWGVPQDGPANVSVDELFWMGRTLVAATHGRGVFRADVSNVATVALTASAFAVMEGAAVAPVCVRVTTALGTPTTDAVVMNFATSDGTATHGADYQAASGSTAFHAGTPSGAVQCIYVHLIGDTSSECDETFGVALSNVSGAVLGTPSSAVVTIVDDDLAAISIAGAIATEGNGSAPPLSFAVTLSQPSCKPVTVSYATADGSAVSGTAHPDYAATAGTIAFAFPNTTGAVSVALVGDTVHEEAAQTFAVDLSLPANATLAQAHGVGTIYDDDAPPVVSLISTGAVWEGDEGLASAPFAVTVAGNLSEPPVTAPYWTEDGTAQAGGPQPDYVPALGAVTFPPFSTAWQTFGIGVIGDSTDEPDEWFRVHLGQPEHGTLGTADAQGRIADDDPVDTSSPELVPGVELARPMRRGEAHLYRIGQKPLSSYEVILSGIAGDGGYGEMVRVMPDGITWILPSSSPAGATGGFGRTLRWRNLAEAANTHDRLKVWRAGCNDSCGPAFRYEIRLVETTYAIPRFDNTDGQTTTLMVQNRSRGPVKADAHFWAADGRLLATVSLRTQPRPYLEPNESFVLDTTTVPGLAGAGGSITVSHDGGTGALTGKAVLVTPGAGVFDVPMVPRE